MNLVTESTESRPQASDPHPLDSLSDADLMDAWSRDQHAQSLAALVDRYSVMVLSVCRRRCRSEADADDAFQSTFLYLARNCDKIRHPERLPGWLHRVAQRAAVATLKSTKRETEPMVDPPADPDDPLDRLTQRHEAIVLDEELADLPEHYRSAIVLHLCEGRSIQSLAEYFGTTAGSIRGRLQRGKQLLAQRLRRRGIVPVLAFAAANAWTAPASHAAQAGADFADATADGNLPDPPIDTSLLESLLAQGVHLMPSLFTAAGVLTGSALIALMMISTETPGQTASGKDQITIPSSISMSVAQFSAAQSTTNKDNSDGDEFGGQLPDAEDPSKLIWIEKPVVPEPTSQLAKTLMATLDEELDFQIATSLADLPKVLSEAIGLPVLMDDRGVVFARQEIDKVEVKFMETAVPLRTALRRMLRPLGLQAVVEDEGLVITADPSALVHQGIGTSRWISIDQDAAEKIAAALDEETEFEFVEVPLVEAIASIAQLHDLPIFLDRRALDNEGLSDEETVTLTLSKYKLCNALTLLLRELDLRYTVQGESLVITTGEAEEGELLDRIYWLEGTGFANGDYDSIMNSLQNITPDTWEILGGPSTMVPLVSKRPALLISTTYDVHENIAKLLQTLRETHFGSDPVLESVAVPASKSPNGGGQVGGGGGGFF